jgi:hypothetical protein
VGLRLGAGNPRPAALEGDRRLGDRVVERPTPLDQLDEPPVERNRLSLATVLPAAAATNTRIPTATRFIPNPATLQAIVAKNTTRDRTRTAGE